MTTLDLPPQILAYIGDAVYELHIRESFSRQTRNPKTLHRTVVQWVKAPAQAAVMQRLMPLLTEDEIDMFRRGRNLKGNTPKSASMADYRHSTGFETMIGHLKVSGQVARLREVLNAIDAIIASPLSEETNLENEGVST